MSWMRFQLRDRTIEEKRILEGYGSRETFLMAPASTKVFVNPQAQKEEIEKRSIT